MVFGLLRLGPFFSCLFLSVNYGLDLLARLLKGTGCHFASGEHMT